ncbi:YggS family pyridoxal phosphate-dependent enzyme [Flavobacteriales bacterium]|nr:YggS family pyridoxal phosphate-dependent enzyme [Flavobacteriaceae bacterium]MDA9750274.1 YggS family pyridoxal phosphate-dependent enzyme [Flavobacteriales bacterium]GIR98185.1 MAG: YggS family pyridoxal phosphate enzyme [Flavobacteriaceae bacterium]|tara:strand:+ start:1729 stop:2364 length:636 start_codon:yes stop_codon:yes gene_type:complete
MIEDFRNLRNKNGDNVKTIAVSKRSTSEEILSVYNLNHKDFGENRVQDLIVKYNKLPKDINWHMIGHLQRNKVKDIIEFIHLIHSVDSLRLLDQINKESSKKNLKTNILIQVKVSQDVGKYGFLTDELDNVFKNYLSDKYRNINILGLMGMATFTDNISQIESEFSLLSTLYNKYSKMTNLKYLSMGMSGDYLLALKYNSNMIRLGSAIFN